MVLTTAMLGTPAGAAPPGTPISSSHKFDPAVARAMFEKLHKTVDLTGSEGQVTALVQLTTKAGVDVTGGPAAVRRAAATTEAVAEDVVPTELTDRNAGTATPKRIATLTNLASATLVQGDAAQIAALVSSSDVKAVYRVVPKTIGNSNTVAFTKALQTWQDTGETGDGVSIAVIDTGLDYTHADFGGAGTVEAYEAAYGEDGTQPIPAGSFDEDKFLGGYDFAGPLYDASGEEPGSTLVPTPDENPIDAPLDAGGHGSHVAGTAAGYGVDAYGDTFAGDYSLLSDLSGFKIGPGSAPEAQLYSYKVFGDIGGSTDLVSLALDRAADPNGDGDFSDHADVINMSLGSTGSPVDDPENALVDELTALGVTVVTSQGNSDDLTDIGGSPGSATSALAVASSVANPVLDSVKIAAPAPDGFSVGQLLPAQNSIAYSGTADLTAPVAFVAADFSGCTPFTPTQAGIVAGKIAYLWWDDNDATRACGSIVRFGNARAAGALGVLIGTENPVFAAGISGDVIIPGAQMTSTTTDALMPSITDGSLTLTIGPSLAQTSRLDGYEDTVSSFSSRGAHGSLGTIKPDVAAPGDGIQSVSSGTGDGSAVLSGTSMASPHVAGIAALVRAAHPTWSAAETKAAIMNTSTHDVVTEPGPDGVAYGPLRVGSGRVDALQAVDDDVIAYNTQEPARVSVTFGVVDVADETVVQRQTVTVKNLGASTRTYATSVSSASTSGGATITASPASITVAPGHTALVTLTLTVDPSTLERELEPTMEETQLGIPRDFVSSVSGRLVLTSTDDDQELRVPVQAAPRLVADLTASAVAFGPSSEAGLALSGTGIASGGWYSLTTPLILGATSPKLEDSNEVTSDSARKAGDIRSIGWSSTAPALVDAGGEAADGRLVLGMVTDGEWATLGLSTIPVFDIDIDGDGSYDIETYVQKYAGTDLSLAFTVDYNTGDTLDVQLANDQAGDLDTGINDNNVVTVSLGLEEAGITPGDTPVVSAWTYSDYAAGGVRDVASDFTVDPYTPPFWFENDIDSPWEGGTGSGISTLADGGVTIPVHRSSAAVTGKLLVLNPQNDSTTNRAQILTVSVPKATATALTVTGGTSYGSTATLKATVSPAAAGKVTFYDGSKVIKTVTVSGGKASTTAKLTVGTHKIKASFTPTSTTAYAASSSSVKTVVVTKSATTTKLTLSPTTVKKGVSAKAIITVTGATSPPAGVVKVTEGTKVLGSGTLVVSGKTGKVTIVLPKTLTVGSHALKVTYTGSGTTTASSATATLKVVP
ncbi:peptidase S8 [Cellulomonas composti]|uniref:Peptidase S8 n=1 Tax=Cellulomonas composti TaxID=266130 RepID=A0A511JBD0_9CELL|nr:peptidase S8 [Cellulomonas composti]